MYGKNKTFSFNYQSSKQVKVGAGYLLCFVVEMPHLNENDCSVFIACFLEKRWWGTKICKEFRTMRWILRTIYRLIDKIEKENSTARKKGSGRPKSASTAQN